MDHHIIHRGSMRVVPLNQPAPRIPDLHCPILAGCNHPLSLAMEPNAGDIISVSLELQHRVGIRGFYVVESNGEMTGRREESLVGGDTESVDLRVGMLNRT